MELSNRPSLETWSGRRWRAPSMEHASIDGSKFDGRYLSVSGRCLSFGEITVSFRTLHCALGAMIVEAYRYCLTEHLHRSTTKSYQEGRRKAMTTLCYMRLRSFIRDSVLTEASRYRTSPPPITLTPENCRMRDKIRDFLPSSRPLPWPSGTAPNLLRWLGNLGFHAAMCRCSLWWTVMGASEPPPSVDEVGWLAVAAHRRPEKL